jgi:lysophospholipase L1-like esterase
VYRGGREFALDSRPPGRINTFIPPSRIPAVLRRLTLVCVALGCLTPLQAADPFEFKDGDRVVFLGSTLIEREQRYGYWELALTLKNKDKTVTFRNLGWSGDTVFGEARNGFDASPRGFERLVSLTRELKPTVIIICYGHNESFEGKAGVPKFTAGLEKLLDALAPTKARIVLMTPTPFERVGPITDPDPRNLSLADYCDAMSITAVKRGVGFFDLHRKVVLTPGLAPPHTENGLHLGPDGYRKTATVLTGTPGPIRETEALRAKIVEKNQLFFHRWRPQNETYLYLFRKHEQGKNAQEIPLFDPLIKKAEKEIAELKKAFK